MSRQAELTRIIEDAENKEALIEKRIDEGILTYDEQFNHLHMYQMNVRRRLLAQKELNNILLNRA